MSPVTLYPDLVLEIEVKTSVAVHHIYKFTFAIIQWQAGSSTIFYFSTIIFISIIK
jgi:hypothetical protein